MTDRDLKFCGQLEAGRRQDALEAAFVSGSISRRRFMALSLALGLLSVSSIEAVAQSLEEIKSNQASQGKWLAGRYDYVVCGGGSAACAIVGRLAADKSKNILVIEAGGWDDAQSILDPRIWFTNFGTERAWSDMARPSPGVNSRSILQTTGRVLGGGSSINATNWMRPFKNDFEFWATAAKDEKWGYEHALSIYRRAENWQGSPNERYRGKGGPVWCQPAHDPSPIAPAMLDACRALGFPVMQDINGEREETGQGFALSNHIIRNGQRQDMARSYLYPVLSQKNVTLLVNTHVERVIIKGGKATGVEFIHNGNRRTVAANREVIVSAGAINTPLLLMLSGIGDEAHLKSVGIKPVVHSPEVGRNFQDHVLHGGCLWESAEKMELRNSGTEVAGYLMSEAGLERPDLAVVQVELPFTTDVIGRQYNPPQTSWAICATLVTPKSRGRVRLKSNDSRDRPIVEPNYLDHPDDVRVVGRSIELCRQIGNANAMRPFSVGEVVPGRKLVGDELVNFIRNGAASYNHPSGTCRMGADANAVVDAELRVNGVANLRIADSSIMPRVPASALMAPTVHIGERMAEMLLHST